MSDEAREDLLSLLLVPAHLMLSGWILTLTLNTLRKRLNAMGFTIPSFVKETSNSLTIRLLTW